jgi:hypothetical protein
MSDTSNSEGGRVMVTLFECGALWKVVLLLAIHHRVERDVERRVPGLIGVATSVDWRSRRIFSISLWKNAESVYGMGEVPRHVYVARMSRRFGISTRCGVFQHIGDWKVVMFGSKAGSASPLGDLRSP